MFDKYVYPILEKIGEGIEKIYWFCSNNKQEVTWFSFGFIVCALINLII
ncbi:hypothetical protein Aegir_gp2 [Pelagibacter phage Aegir EXVC013S]|nr:hypothetical protein Aegir_gp2 [Pelagibacter phage Aegir EXVC013S]QLF88492.1 hypothetical protein Kolga_gp45 [Pelagibacter phage Kolga EXVC016S]